MFGLTANPATQVSWGIQCRIWMPRNQRNEYSMISADLKPLVEKFNEQGKMSFLEATTEEKISKF